MTAAHPLENTRIRVDTSNENEYEDINRELPFLERDFSLWMDQLEELLFLEAHWKNLLKYKGISLYDAAYASLYWDFLDVYRQAYCPDCQENENPVDLLSRGKSILNRLQQGEITIQKGIEISKARFINWVNMGLPAHELPELATDKRTLVLRAFPNQSSFPVLPTLVEQGATILFASWSDKNQIPIEELGIPYIHLKSFYRRKYKSAYKTHQKAIAEMLSKVDTFLPGQLLGKLSQYNLDWDASTLLERSFTQARVYIDLYLDLLEKFVPDTVVMFNENSLPGRTMAKVAKSVSIPSIAIQHGLFIGYVYRNLATDKMIVWGERPRKYWLDRGCEPENVVSVGPIAHENWTSVIQTKKDSVSESLDQILFLGQNPAAFISKRLHKRSIHAMVMAAKKNPDVEFIFKTHPREPSKIYRNIIIRGNVDNIQLITCGSIEPFLISADLVVTIFSTAGVEAMLLGCPVIVLNLSSEKSLAPYVSSALEARTEKDLILNIENVLENKKLRKSLIQKSLVFAKEYLGDVDGLSATRAAKVIIKETYEV